MKGQSKVCLFTLLSVLYMSFVASRLLAPPRIIRGPYYDLGRVVKYDFFSLARTSTIMCSYLVNRAFFLSRTNNLLDPVSISCKLVFSIASSNPNIVPPTWRKKGLVSDLWCFLLPRFGTNCYWPIIDQNWTSSLICAKRRVDACLCLIKFSPRWFSTISSVAKKTRD